MNQEPKIAYYKTIGQHLLEGGKISSSDADQIYQKQKSGNLLFGEAAVELGLITEDDLKRALSSQFKYPYVDKNSALFKESLVAAYSPFSKQVENLRSLRSQLMIRWFSEQGPFLAIVGAKAGDGCSYMASNLAVVFSQMGQKTLLIDANLRHPSQKAIFHLEEKRGLSDILAGRADGSVVVGVQSLHSLSVLTSGTVPPNPQELLHGSIFQALLDESAKVFDIVLIDCPPADECADFEILSSRARGALLVSRKHHSKLSDIATLKERIQVTGANLVGAVLNEY